MNKVQKFKIKMFESREFEHEIVVEAKDEVDIINSLNRTGDNIKTPNIKDYVNYLKNNGIKVLDITKDEVGKKLLSCNNIERVK